MSSLLTAVHRGDLAAVDRLLQSDEFHSPFDSDLAFYYACVHGHLAIVERLLQDERVDPAYNNNSAFIVACNNVHLTVVDRLLQDKRVDPSSRDNYALRNADIEGYSAVIDRLLEDERVDPVALLKPVENGTMNYYPVNQLTDAMLPRLAATLSLPFLFDSGILLWQPRLRQYRAEHIEFMDTLIASWQWHRGGMCRDVIDHIVCEYVFGKKLRDFVALDAEYVASPPLLTDPTVSVHQDEHADGDNTLVAVAVADMCYECFSLI
jgi:hypothetical protein